jgi:hypothetical protein
MIWFVPGLFEEINRLKFFTEAIHDLHIVPIPYTEETLDMAYQNARAYEPEMVAGKATIQDRQASLMEIYRRTT